MPHVGLAHGYDLRIGELSIFSGQHDIGTSSIEYVTCMSRTTVSITCSSYYGRARTCVCLCCLSDLALTCNNCSTSNENTQLIKCNEEVFILMFEEFMGTFF